MATKTMLEGHRGAIATGIFDQKTLGLQVAFTLLSVLNGAIATVTFVLQLPRAPVSPYSSALKRDP